MKLFGTHKSWLPAALGLWLLAACAPTYLPSSEPAAPFAKQTAREVFRAGFKSISEKYIEPISPAQLALTGLKGLGTIDPAVSVRREGGAVLLSASDEQIGRFTVPADADTAGWANLVVNVWSAGRGVSRDIRLASEEKLYEAVFDGALSSMDIYSRYAGVKEATKNRARRDGFGGVGIRFKIAGGKVHITRVMRRTPAAVSGLRIGDRITHVGDVPVEGLNAADVAQQIRGPVKSEVALTVVRLGRKTPLVVILKRALIVRTTVTYGHKNGIVYLKVKGFNKRTSRSLAGKLLKARKTLGKKIKGYVLDLRGNPGGLLKQSIKLADLFLKKGNIISTRGRHLDSVQYYEASGRDLAQGLPLVVLVDGKSASAAEVAAAALQDLGRGVVIGTTSFGKGSVQTVIRLPNDGEITLTWSRLYAPSGYVLHGLGVRPSICTSGTDEARKPDPKMLLVGERNSVTGFRAWRSARLEQQKYRKDLRGECPAERRKKAVEVEIARRLLNDSALYRRTLLASLPPGHERIEEATKATGAAQSP